MVIVDDFSQDTLGLNFLEKIQEHVRNWKFFAKTTKRERGSYCQDKE